MPTPLSVKKPFRQAHDQQLRAEFLRLQQQLAEAQNTIDEQSRVVELAKELLLYAPSKLSKLDDAIMELHGGEWRRRAS